MMRALMLVCLFMLAMPAAAQDMPQASTTVQPAAPGGPPLLMLTRGKPTHPERVVMLWHKMVQQTPDFSVWAKKSPLLRQAKAMDHDIIVNGETNRLQQSWNDFDTNQLLNIQTIIHLNNYSTLQERLVIDEFTPQTFFSYMMYDENVAIVPKDIAQFNKLKFTKAQMEEMLKKAGSGQIAAELILKPVEADGKTPFVRGQYSYWLVLAKIEEIRFWSTMEGKDQLVWMYRADDYKPKEDKTLLDLKAGADIQ